MNSAKSISFTPCPCMKIVHDSLLPVLMRAKLSSTSTFCWVLGAAALWLTGAGWSARGMFRASASKSKEEENRRRRLRRGRVCNFERARARAPVSFFHSFFQLLSADSLNARREGQVTRGGAGRPEQKLSPITCHSPPHPRPSIHPSIPSGWSSLRAHT